MNKRRNSKLTSRNVRSRLSKNDTFEDEKCIQGEPNILGRAAAENKWSKKSHFKAIKRQQENERNRQKLYEISDSSDEDFEHNTIFNSSSRSINDIFEALKGTEISKSTASTSDRISDTEDFVNNLFKTNKNTRISDTTPSTSVMASDTTDFVDDLLKTNKELLNGSIVKSYEELCKETDQLLASTLELFNENSDANSTDSVTYVCADKNSMKTSRQENLAPNKSSPDVSGNKPGQACPICLETLGGELTAWSTFCGHVFCKYCIENWISSQKNCPTCRKKLTIKKIHQLFLN